METRERMEVPALQASSMLEQNSALEIEDRENKSALCYQEQYFERESTTESLSSACSELESVELVVEDVFVDKDSEVNTPEKAIIESGVGDLDEANSSICTRVGTLISETEPEKVLGGIENFEVVRDEEACKHDSIQGKALSFRLQTDILQERKHESSLVKMLWRQLDNLAQREKEVEQTLSKERIENLVCKVEEEVEFEGVVEDMCLRLRAEGEYMDMERREIEWDRERREVRLEEEVELLRKRVYSLEEEIRIANTEKQYSLQFQEDQHLLNFRIGNTGQADDDRLMDVSAMHQVDFRDPGEGVLAAFKDMLLAAEEKAEQEHRAFGDLEGTFRNEQQRWSDTEQQLENHIYALEKEVSNMKEIIKEKESVISLERDRRRQYGLEVDKVLAFWREENGVHSRVCERLNKFEKFRDEFGERVMHLRTTLLTGENEVELLLMELLKDLEDLDNEENELIDPSKCQQLEWELTDRWKLQRDLLEGEREKLEEKLEQAARQARDNEKRVESLSQQKERDLLESIRDLETKLGDQEEAWREKVAGIMSERQTWDIEAEVYRKELEVERERVQAMRIDREKWVDEQVKEWAGLLDVKDEEVRTLRSAHEKVADTLLASKQHLVDIRRQLVKSRRGSSRSLRFRVQNEHENFDKLGGVCTGESDLETSWSKDRSEVDDGEVYCVDLKQVAMDINEEIKRLSRVITREQKRLEKERMEVRIGTEELKDERKELEKKVADALVLMEDLKKQLRTTEGQMERERRQMEIVLMDKTDEVESLKKLLSMKELENEANTRKFKDELSLIEKEVEKERKEREEVMDLHFTSRRKLIKEMKEKEARWEKEVEASSQEIQDLRNEMHEKDNQLLRLKKEVGLLELAVKQERLSRETEFCVTSQESKLGVERCYESPSKSAGDFSKNLALANFGKPCVEITTSDDAYTDGFSNNRVVEWQDVIGKIAGFDKQIAEAMVAIQSLKEELNAKEKELQRARMERELDHCKEIQEESCLFEEQIDFDGGHKEQLLLRDKEELIKLLEAEKADTADAMSTLQGAVRELQWALKHSKGKGEDNKSFEIGKEGTVETQMVAAKDDLVKVHASHLEELDHLILELKSKAEEAEKRARAAEVALAVHAVKEGAKNAGTALVKVGKDWFNYDQSRLTSRSANEALPPYIGREWAGESGVGAQEFQSPSRKQPKSGKGSGRFNHNLSESAGTSFRMFGQEQRWHGRSAEHNRLLDVGISSPGLDGTSSSSSTSSWMTVRGAADDNFVMHDPFQQGALTLAVSTPPPRNQRRWMVDASWIENVRKEQASLKQQLELERQHISALRQVELENRWMEETIVHALEQKRESDTRVLELERKVAFLESMIARKGGIERSSSSSSFYKGVKG